MTLLTVEGLRLHYATRRGALRAVDSVSFALPESGRALGIIGESGSGKTSLALALMRLLPKNTSLYEGCLRFKGQDLLALSDEQFRREIRWTKMSMVFQGAMNSLNPVLCVGDQVAERMLLDGTVTRREAHLRVRHLLEQVGLPAEIFRRYAHELSGGMKQRVVIAMALALQPALILLDEPTSALDVSVQAQIVNLLKVLKWEMGVSMIFITHDIALASDICDDIAVMYAGEIREYGDADQVMKEPSDPYTRHLLASIPRLHDAIWPQFLDGSPPDMTDPYVGCRFRERCRHAFQLCRDKHPQLVEARPNGQRARCWLHTDTGSRADDARLASTAVNGSTRTPRRQDHSDAEALLYLERLKVYFSARVGPFRTKTVKAVDDVSLTIRHGETVAVVGESGSGKTTLGRATLGLVRPTGGRVIYGGQDLSLLPKRQWQQLRRRMQPIFQDPYSSINDYMSVYELVEEPLAIHGIEPSREREQRVREVLDQVGLTPSQGFVTKYPHLLSGGQRQRVSIARAIVLGPEYIMADEPVSMIDASSRAEILYLLRELQESLGVTLLYITHDIASARHHADRIAVMYLGNVVELGPASAIVEASLHPYTVALLEAVPEPDPENRHRLRHVVPGESSSAAETPTGCPFHSRCPEVITGTCQENRPILLEKAPGHWVACHLSVGAKGAHS